MKKSIEIIIKKKDFYKNPTQRIQKVSPGYAFNYLIPNQIAEIATKGKIRHLHLVENILAKKDNQIHKNNLKVKMNLDKINFLSIRKKCSQNKQIFGSISEQEIISKIFHITGQNIDKKQIKIDSIKQIGKYICEIKIDEDININIEIHVLPNKA